MFTNISTNDTYPKTLLIRNTPDGMIWQVYHVRNHEEAMKLSFRATQNGFYGITLEDHQPDEYEETWPGWRVESKDFEPNDDDQHEYILRRKREEDEMYEQMERDEQYED